MSLVKFKRTPIGNLMTTDIFDNDGFFENLLWNKKLDQPALNIKETDDSFEVELAAPGFDKKDFDVTIEEGCLKITAEKSSSKEEKEDNYTRKEFNYNSFEKRLQLPDSVQEDHIKAAYKNGILSFNLFKKEETKNKKPLKVAIA
ncbi:Hsp20/alpha crystallin family protein [Nonlabens sp.]|uniref:Hsp20/alpha crystallin family protein n=1 Tax=Nonlabens sp. TaxID=1888209 RepID=UPI0025E3A07C|nr:Hsp20/alpha crystallin family protein [Nonlabens sp.]